MATVTTQERTQQHAVPRISSGVGVALVTILFRVSLVLTIGVIGLIGLWAVASLIGGTIAAGGPVELAGAWFSAVSGR